MSAVGARTARAAALGETSTIRGSSPDRRLAPNPRSHSTRRQESDE